MKNNAFAFALGVFLAWASLPKLTHALYWLAILVTGVSGYLIGKV